MLNYIAEQMGLDHLMMEFNQTAISQSMLGNALEALVGAIYIERGFEFTKHFILSAILKKFINMDQLEEFDDNYKSQLLEWCQKHSREIDFKVLSKYKVDKRDRFKVGVFIDGQEISSAEDYNKKVRNNLHPNWQSNILGLRMILIRIKAHIDYGGSPIF